MPIPVGSLSRCYTLTPLPNPQVQQKQQLQQSTAQLPPVALSIVGPEAVSCRVDKVQVVAHVNVGCFPRGRTDDENLFHVRISRTAEDDDGSMTREKKEQAWTNKLRSIYIPVLLQIRTCPVDLCLVVLNDNDGSGEKEELWLATLLASTAALAVAGVEMSCLVTAGTAVVAQQNAAVVTVVRSNDDASPTCTMHVAGTGKTVLWWEQDGSCTAATANEALSLCRQGCRTTQKLVRDFLLRHLEQNKK